MTSQKINFHTEGFQTKTKFILDLLGRTHKRTQGGGWVGEGCKGV
jgi:hypothetical protein